MKTKKIYLVSWTTRLSLVTFLSLLSWEIYGGVMDTEHVDRADHQIATMGPCLNDARCACTCNYDSQTPMAALTHQSVPEQFNEGQADESDTYAHNMIIRDK